MILTPPPPTPPPQKQQQKKIKGKASLSPSHLEEHNCLSFFQLHKNEKQNLAVLKWIGGGKVHSSHDHGLVLY